MLKRRINKFFYDLFIMAFLGILLLLSVQKLYSETTGFKFYNNYSTRDYHNNTTSLMIDQDSRGIIYAANTTGVLEFDGVSWQGTQVPHYFVYSLAIDDSGTIYIGGNGEIGYLIPGATGRPQYVSLMDQLQENQKEFSAVWPVFCIKDKIYFITEKFLFRWDKKKMTVWKSQYCTPGALKCGEKLFINDKDIGLMEIVNDSLKPIPDGKSFIGKEITMMVPYDKKRFLVGTLANGFYLYDGEQMIPFAAEADNYLKDKHLISGIRLSSSPGKPAEFALGTLSGGLVIIDLNGRLRYLFNKTAGLLDNKVNYIFEDSRGNLWLALDLGITRIKYSSPFDIYDERSHLPGMVMSVAKHHGDLYVGTNEGLFFLSSSTPGGFQPIRGISGTCFSLLPVGDSVLAAGDDGVFQIQNQSLRKTINYASCILYRSGIDTRRVWVGTGEAGLVSLYLNSKNGQWIEEKKIENTKGDIRQIVEDQKGNLWLGTLRNGALKVAFPSGIQQPVVTRYYTEHGLPKLDIRVFKAADHFMFATQIGIFRFDQTDNMFVPDRTLGDEFAGGDGTGVYRILEDKNKHIWLHANERNYKAIPQPDGSFVLYQVPFHRTPFGLVNVIYPDPDEDAVWFGGIDGLFRYNTKTKTGIGGDSWTLIRKVRSIDEKFLVFGGYRAKTNNNSPLFLPELEYKYRNLHFEFAAPVFEDESLTTYQYFMEGHDKDWSAWAAKTYANYPDLAPGRYRFRVRAKNVHEQLSREDLFQFKVLPPWYRTWWAFLGYTLVFFLVVYLAVKWRSRKLEQDKLHLEQIIKERTKEINEKNQQLEEMDKIKSRFFANISHEFRTPLTLIMGPLEQILSSYSDRELKKTARIMLRNSQRLLNLVNQLLELAKLDSGKMKLNPSRENIVPVLKTIAACFESLALGKKLELTVHSQEEDITLYFDPDKLEKIIGNLLSNAVKFTPPGGKITISVKKNLTPDMNFSSGSVDISVTDTGIGILDSQLDHVFERFYQAGDSHEYQQKGSGIGLSLSKELVKLHHGEILVHSSTGGEGKTSGTEFIVRLPLGTQHLKPGEIAPPAEETTAISTLTPESTLTTLSAAWDSGKIPGQYIDTIAQEEETIEEPIIHEEIQEEKNIILVVEDSEDMRNYIRGALGSLYRVVEAADGKQGIEKAKEVIPDLIISDIMMPGADGYELCRVLKEDMNTSHIPIILLTAKASDENVIRGLETGADDYITKPFNANILTARIKNLIDLRHQLQLKRKRQMILQPVEIPVSSLEEKFYKELQDTIETNLSDPEFNVDQLHKKLYMGRTSLYRKILALTGETPTQFMRSYRLQRAAQLFKANFGNVTEVAFAVGFSNTAYFAKCFKEKFHRSPSHYYASEVSNL
jgi:signal transduction histidine kinase/DNA-binding response OmpR family regulator